MKTSKFFYAYCVLFVLGWMIVYRYFPHRLLGYSFVAFSLVWAFYRLPTMRSGETLKSFFLYERKMPRKEFIGTLVTTNVGFFSSVAFSTFLIVDMGIGPAVIAVVAWAIGLAWFALYIPKLMPFFQNGSTVHEYIAEAYGRTPDQRRHLRFYSSAITFVLYLASIGAEIKFTADVFSKPTGISTGWLAIALSVAGVIYVSISGYRGVVTTDRLRFWAIVVGVIALYYFIGQNVLTTELQFPPDYFSATMLTFGRKPLSLLSLVVLLSLYQFCVMDMWERCIAIANSDFGSNEQTTAAPARSMRRMIFTSLVPFVLLFAAWYGLGLVALGQQWTVNDPNQIIPELIPRLEALARTSFVGAIVETLIVLCFSAAALSTIDGFIIAAAQTIIFDWIPSFRADHKEWSDLNSAEARHALWAGRILVLLVGALGVSIAYLSFEIMSFWTSMYSLMLSFFPAIFISLSTESGQPRRSARQVALSILSGAVAALAAGVVGTFIIDEPTVVSLAPFLAVGVAALMLLRPDSGGLPLVLTSPPVPKVDVERGADASAAEDASHAVPDGRADRAWLINALVLVVATIGLVIMVAWPPATRHEPATRDVEGDSSTHDK